jgi:hypothetical protein
MSNSLEPLPLLDGTSVESINEIPDQLTSDYIFKYGKEVFQDTANFANWLTKPNLALGGLIPIELLVEGGEENLNKLNTIIGRIDYGIFS